MAGYADSAAALRGFLNLLAGRAFEVCVVFAVAVEPAAERSVEAGYIPVQLGTHLGVIL
jgi:hypothetical protein